MRGLSAFDRLDAASVAPIGFTCTVKVTTLQVRQVIGKEEES